MKELDETRNMNVDSSRNVGQQLQQEWQRIVNTPQSRQAKDRMWISSDEREWAKQIKAAVAQTPELDDLHDFMYAQMAIVSMTDADQTNVEVILDRFRVLQQLREENGIVNTLAHGSQLLQTLIFDLVPGSFLAYSFVDHEESYVCSMDMTSFDMDVLRDPRKEKEWLAASYYLMHAFNLDLDATRRGLIILAECENYHWKGKDMVHAGAFRKWWSELALVYPLNVQKVKYFHTGLFMNLLMSTAKKFLPQSVQQRMELGCRSEGGRLDQLFMVPDKPTANQRLVMRLQDALKSHYENQATFVL